MGSARIVQEPTLTKKAYRRTVLTQVRRPESSILEPEPFKDTSRGVEITSLILGRLSGIGPVMEAVDRDVEGAQIPGDFRMPENRGRGRGDRANRITASE